MALFIKGVGGCLPNQPFNLSGVGVGVGVKGSTKGLRAFVLTGTHAKTTQESQLLQPRGPLSQG